MDVSQYLEIFIDETKEHLQSLNEQLLILEKEPENQDTINEIFRAAHSLKGMAGTMGYKRMQNLTHNMENVFSEIRNGKMSVTAPLVDVLFKGLDSLEGFLENIISSGDEGTDDCEEIIASLNRLLQQGLGIAPAEEVSASAAVATQTETKKKETGDREKYKEFRYADFEQQTIKEAVASGQHAYGITVWVQETCLLKDRKSVV